MIGMMNVGQDSAVEFYATARQSSLYQRKTSKDSRTYNAEGRVFINGVPVTQESPENLWQDVIQKMVAQKMIMREIEEKPPGRLSSVLRRLSSKLRRVASDAAVESMSPQKEEAEIEKHITMIRINSINASEAQKAQSSNPQQTQIEEGILRRLWEERERIERERGEIHRSEDSGHASFDESTEIAVHRL